VANPINRYLINSPMLPQLKRDADGGITLYIQNESPGKEKEANWLPRRKVPFVMAMRLYWPKEEAVDLSGRARRRKRSEINLNRPTTGNTNYENDTQLKPPIRSTYRRTGTHLHGQRCRHHFADSSAVA